MKKSNLLVLGAALVLGLASCGGNGGIDTTKPYLKANGEIGGAPSTFEIYLKEENKAFFDFTVTGKLPSEEMQQAFNTQFDMEGTYKVEEKNYIFTFVQKGPEGQTANKDFTAKYVEGKEHTHELEFPMMTDLGPKVFTLTGSLPL